MRRKHPFGIPCTCGHTRDQHEPDGSKCLELGCLCEVFTEQDDDHG